MTFSLLRPTQLSLNNTTVACDWVNLINNISSLLTPPSPRSIISACPHPGPQTALATSAATMTGQLAAHCSTNRPAREIPCSCRDIPTSRTFARRNPRIPLVLRLAVGAPHRGGHVPALHGHRVPSAAGKSSCSAPLTVADDACACHWNCPRPDSLATTASLRSPRTSDGTPPRKRTATWVSAPAFSYSAFAATPSGTDEARIRY